MRNLCGCVKVADLFCGAGGSSTGARRALARLGLSMELVAVNHWSTAIETHTRNHPDAVHLCADLFGADPRTIVPGGRLDLLMASPTCTFHSRARGGRPTSRDQKYGRMTPTQVYRWATELDVRHLLVENVPEFEAWGPYDWCPRHKKCPKGSSCRPRDERCRAAGCAVGKPCRRRAGMYFRAWVARFRAAGWHVEWRTLNAADYGDATTRERFFMIGRRDPRRPCAHVRRARGCRCAPVRWPEPTHSRDGSGDLFGGGRERWRAAREVIDPTLVGRSIFDRPQGPLSAKTLSRILAGAVRFAWPAELVRMIEEHMRTGGDPRRPVPGPDAERAPVEGAPFVLSRHAEGAPRSVEEPTPTQVAKHSHLLVEPFLTIYHGQSTASPLDAPAPTLTTKDRLGLVVPVTHAGKRRPRDLSAPLPTVTGAHRGELALVLPQNGSNPARSVEDPVPVVTTTSRGIMHAEPFLARSDMHKSNAACVRSIDAPVPTITTGGGVGVAMPFMPAAFGERRGQAPRVHAVTEPVPTIPAKGRVNYVEPRHYDVLYRMLQPHELAAAMSFNDEGEAYSFSGTKTEKVKQIGNAVPVRTASALVAAIMRGA